MDIKYPNITAPDYGARLEQVRSYLYQLVDQLNFALNLDASSASAQQQIIRSGGQAVEEKEDSQATFNSIKSLIISSADVVNAYYDKIVKRLEGVYVAESDFGTYAQQTSQTIEATSQSVESLYTNIQQILTDIENVDSYLIDVKATIKAGELYTEDDGTPVYGIEIGQINTVNGEVKQRFARFTSSKLSFYDQNGTEVAWISGEKLYITHAEVTGTLTIGRYVLDTSNGLAFKWV